METKHIILPYYFGKSFSGCPLETHLMLQVETDVFHNPPINWLCAKETWPVLPLRSHHQIFHEKPWDKGFDKRHQETPPPSYLGTSAKSLNSWSWFLCLSHSIHQNNPSLVRRSRKMILCKKKNKKKLCKQKLLFHQTQKMFIKLLEFSKYCDWDRKSYET